MVLVSPEKIYCIINPEFQWNLLDVGSENAWYYTQGSSDIVVAVIDSGIDFTHPDLVNQSWINANEIPANGIDDDNNGYIDDFIGWDFRNNDNDPSPGHPHGTFVAGLIAADNDEDIIVGIAPNIKLMAIRFLDNDNSFSIHDWGMFAEAIDYAVTNGADIINLSIQALATPPKELYDAIKRAYDKGVIIVGVTGNKIGLKEHVHYPGNYSEVIAVSATSQSREIADFSCRGEQNEICAPGDEVYSIQPNKWTPQLDSGTSFAAPLVSGAIALMLSINSELSIDSIRTVLHETSIDLGDSGKDPSYGYGLLNVHAALEALISDPLLMTLTDHNSSVWGVTFDPIGQILASASTDTRINLWDVKTGNKIRSLEGHSAPVFCVTIDPNSEKLASGSADNLIKIWNITDGKSIQNFVGHTSVVWGVAFSPDGQILASASADRVVKLWNVTTGQLMHNLTNHTDSVRDIDFDLSGKTLASGSMDGTIKLWDVTTGKLIDSLTNHTDGVLSVAFSPDGNILASGSFDNTIKLWNVESGLVERTLSGHTSYISTVSFSPDGKVLASGSNDTNIMIWDMETGLLMANRKGHNATVSSVVFDALGEVLASGSVDNTIKLWNVSDIDLDGMLDTWERIYGLNPSNFQDRFEDVDQDNLSNILEFQFGTNPQLKDTDGDLIPDGYEYFNKLNGTLNDSNDDFDSDKIPNLYEYQNGLQAGIDDALDDLDNDTLSNLDEFLLGTSPKEADTDNDGWGDGIEILLGTNPLKKVSNPFFLILLLIIVFPYFGGVLYATFRHLLSKKGSFKR